MSLIKIPKEVKLKNLPLEIRVVLRLVTLLEQGKTEALMLPMSKELGVKFAEVLKVVQALAAKKVITPDFTTANSFTFEMDPQTRKDLQLTASNYDKHLKARAFALARAKQNQQAPPHLVPITNEQRKPWMEKGKEIAKKIGAPPLAYKVANCIARIGEEEVATLLDATLDFLKNCQELHKQTPSAVAVFFRLYVVRRDQLIPATATAA